MGCILNGSKIKQQNHPRYSKKLLLINIIGMRFPESPKKIIEICYVQNKKRETIGILTKIIFSVTGVILNSTLKLSPRELAFGFLAWVEANVHLFTEYNHSLLHVELRKILQALIIAHCAQFLFEL